VKIGITNEYKQMFPELLADLDEFDVSMKEMIYIVRGSAQKVIHNNTGQIKIYAPIIDYYLYLDEIEERENYERVAAGKVLLEMADMSVFKQTNT